MSAAEKPVPVPTESEKPYWDGLREHKLVLVSCVRCNHLTQRLPIVCLNCGSEEFGWKQVSGRGTVYSYAISRTSTVTGFDDELPYVMVLVAIEEQPQLVLTTNLVGEFNVDDLDINLPVEAVYEERGDATILQFGLV